VELFRGVNVDWLGKKWYFLAFSLVFSVAGLFSMLFWHHIPYGVDFRGGTLVYVKFSHPPDDNALRAAMDRAGLRNAKAKGRKLGRPAKQVNAAQIAALRAQGVPWRRIGAQLGVSPATAYAANKGRL